MTVADKLVRAAERRFEAAIKVLSSGSLAMPLEILVRNLRRREIVLAGRRAQVEALLGHRPGLDGDADHAWTGSDPGYGVELRLGDETSPCLVRDRGAPAGAIEAP